MLTCYTYFRLKNVVHNTWPILVLSWFMPSYWVSSCHMVCVMWFISTVAIAILLPWYPGYCIPIISIRMTNQCRKWHHIKSQQLELHFTVNVASIATAVIDEEIYLFWLIELFSFITPEYVDNIASEVSANKGWNDGFTAINQSVILFGQNTFITTHWFNAWLVLKYCSTKCLIPQTLQITVCSLRKCNKMFTSCWYIKYSCKEPSEQYFKCAASINVTPNGMLSLLTTRLTG